MRCRYRQRRVELLWLVLTVVGCGATAPSDTVTVTLDRSNLSIVQGGRDSLFATMILTRPPGGVNVYAESAAGVHIAVSDYITTDLTTRAKVVFTVDPTTTPIAYYFTVHATSAFGSLEGVAGGVVSVTAAH